MKAKQSRFQDEDPNGPLQIKFNETEPKKQILFRLATKKCLKIMGKFQRESFFPKLKSHTS